MTAPYTGLDRADWLATADRLLAALRPWASADHATITPPGTPGGYGTRIDGLEGFARSFMGAAFRIAGTDDAASAELAEWYAEGSRRASTPAMQGAGCARASTIRRRSRRPPSPWGCT
jgi:hypothetical protein